MPDVDEAPRGTEQNNTRPLRIGLEEHLS